jgi:hypothetical protein
MERGAKCVVCPRLKAPNGRLTAADPVGAIPRKGLRTNQRLILPGNSEDANRTKRAYVEFLRMRDTLLASSSLLLSVILACKLHYIDCAVNLRRLKDKPYFKRYDKLPETLTKVGKYPVGIDCVELISSAKIHPTCGIKFHYPVMKYFEIPACGALLIADWFDELASLGSKDNVNMVKLNKKKLKEQAEYWLTHGKQREEITKAGEILIQQRHTVDIRAREFIERLEGLGRGYPVN